MAKSKTTRRARSAAHTPHLRRPPPSPTIKCGATPAKARILNERNFGLRGSIMVVASIAICDIRFPAPHASSRAGGPSVALVGVRAALSGELWVSESLV